MLQTMSQLLCYTGNMCPSPVSSTSQTLLQTMSQLLCYTGNLYYVLMSSYPFNILGFLDIANIAFQQGFFYMNQIYQSVKSLKSFIYSAIQRQYNTIVLHIVFSQIPFIYSEKTCQYSYYDSVHGVLRWECLALKLCTILCMKPLCSVQ